MPHETTLIHEGRDLCMQVMLFMPLLRDRRPDLVDAVFATLVCARPCASLVLAATRAHEPTATAIFLPWYDVTSIDLCPLSN